MKSQISFEFIVLFAVVFFIFLSVLVFFSVKLEKNPSTKTLAVNHVKNIKMLIITASVSESDFESEITLPDKINEIEIRAEIAGDPDNLILIKDRNSGEIIASEFLPKIDSLSPLSDGKLVLESPDLTLKIKNENRFLTLTR